MIIRFKTKNYRAQAITNLQEYLTKLFNELNIIVKKHVLEGLIFQNFLGEVPQTPLLFRGYSISSKALVTGSSSHLAPRLLKPLQQLWPGQKCLRCHNKLIRLKGLLPVSCSLTASYFQKNTRPIHKFKAIDKQNHPYFNQAQGDSSESLQTLLPFINALTPWQLRIATTSSKWYSHRFDSRGQRLLVCWFEKMYPQGSYRIFRF